MPKKTINIILAVLLASILFFLIYFFFFRSVAEDPEILDREELFDPFGEPFPSTTLDDFINENQFQIEFDGDSRLKKITGEPVSGFNIFLREFDDGQESEKQVVFKYVERATGHIYLTTFDYEENRRISNITTPKIHESIFLNDGDEVIYRFLSEEDQETIKTYKTTFDFGESADSEENVAVKTSSSFFIDNLTQLIKSNDGKLFGLISNKSNSGFNSLGFLINTEDVSDVDVILNSQISEWRGQWVGENRIALTTRSSYKAEGYSYILDLNTGLFLRDLGPIQGLNTVYSPDGRYVLYSSSTENGTATAIYNRETNMETRSIVRTIADKCSWSSDSINLYCATSMIFPSGVPDDWYKGLVDFNDTIVSYNMEEGEIQILNQFDENLVPSLDIVNIKISEDKDFILFQNKNDLSLWAYDLRVSD